MALAAKPIAAGPTPGVSTPRGPSTVSSPRSPVATFSGSVEATSPAFGAHIEDANTSVVDQEGESRFGHRYQPSYRDDRDVPTPHTGIIDTPSQSFVAMLELRDTFDASQVAGDKASKKFIGRLVGKAVALYEANVQPDSGDRPIRGDTVSLTL